MPRACSWVAVALAWVRTGTDKEAPDLLSVLNQQSTAWLALRLAAIADGNAELTRLLLAEAADPEVPGALAELRAELESALDAHEEEAARKPRMATVSGTRTSRGSRP